MCHQHNSNAGYVAEISCVPVGQVPAVHHMLTSLLAGVGLDLSSSAAAPSAAGLGGPAQQQQQQQAVSSVPRPLSRGWQCPQLGWGLCSPADGLLQSEWVWLFSAGGSPLH
jgi:hypothetical protein